MFLSDGKTYDVTNRAYAYMTPAEFILGLNPDESGFPTRSVYISPNHSVRVEPLEAASR